MGRGDKKSKKGKIFKGSFGNSRKRTAVKTKAQSATVKPEAATEEAAKPKRTAKKKAEA